jgi:tellurite resistance protein
MDNSGTFLHLITSVGLEVWVLAALGVSVVIAYLKINKLWGRKHIREVAESISVAAALLSLFTTLPFLVKFALVDEDFVAAGKFVVSLCVFAVFFLVGIGYWTRRSEKVGLWVLLRRALATERGELTYLMQSFTKPREADAILRILRLVSMVDREFDAREAELLESVARPWGIETDELTAGHGELQDVDINQVRSAFTDYLAMKPPCPQVEKVNDLVKFMVHADSKVSKEESVVLDEISGAVGAYLAEVGEDPVLFEVLLVPQKTEHHLQIQELLSEGTPLPRAGGEAFVVGAYFSESFAQAICHRFRNRQVFSTVERLEPDGQRARMPGPI